jgi:asparagine synthase (glutamine-hydrolysing)
VLRDCSGRLPCYRLRHSLVDLFFADPAVLCSLGLAPGSCNWDYICAFLCSSQLQIRDTALQGVTELLAGDCFQITPSERRIDCAWSPAEVLELPLIDRFASATQLVRSVTNYCITAWASIFQAILLSLSGGLDSSVVLACLARSHTRSTIVCVNKYGANVTEDERMFARLAASSASVQLLEIPIVSDEQRIDQSLTHMPLTAKPTVSGTIGALEMLALNPIAETFKATGIWTGQGGDHLFMQTRLPIGLIDYVALRGLGLGLVRSLHDAVHISKWNYWRTASLLWRRDTALDAGARGRGLIDRHPFITADARSRVRPESFLHPWVLNTESLPAGQRAQISALSEVLNRHRPLPGLELIHQHHPLLSQPLIELCLRIPSYVHLRGGIDRAVERAAFADLVPREITTRRQKGQSTFSILGMLNRSRKYVRDLVLDGVLVKQDILDRAALEPLLNGQRPTDATNFWPLFAAIAAELWVQNWRNCTQNTPASHCATPVKLL